MVSRLSAQWSLTESLFKFIFHVPKIILMVEEVTRALYFEISNDFSILIDIVILQIDKREILTGNVTHFLQVYANTYSHNPISSGDQLRASAYLQHILLSVGGGSRDLVPNDVPVLSGLRQETYAGFIMAHMIGHVDLDPPNGISVWASRTLCCKFAISMSLSW
jgi:hypothetical protein